MPYIGNVATDFNVGTDNINNDAITTAKIADGAILDVDVNASAAIDGTKISPNFGSQNRTSTGTSTAASFIPTSSTVPTNGVYLPAANSVAISTNGTGRLFVDGSGRVGINVASPLHPLDVSAAAASTAIHATDNTNADLFLDFPSPSITRFVSQYGTNGQFVFANGTGKIERMRLDNSGRLGLGTSSPSETLHVAGSIRAGTVSDYVYSNNLGQISSSQPLALVSNSETVFKNTSNQERLRIDSSGRLLVGTSSTSSSANIVVAGGDGARGVINVASTAATPASGDDLGFITFNDSSHIYNNAIIRAQRDGGTWTATTSKPTRLVFSTTADGASSPTERMRITQAGSVAINCTGLTNAAPDTAGGIFTSTGGLIRIRVTGDGASALQFFSPTGGTSAAVGSVFVNASSTSYSTSSDYRLKENVSALTGAIERINQLQVHRFNFIADPDRTVDGFIAHEAQAVVPECVTGEKDAVDADGNPVYQGIDQSKLVPLLTAALQEAIAKIETLEAEVAALKAV